MTLKSSFPGAPVSQVTDNAIQQLLYLTNPIICKVKYETFYFTALNMQGDHNGHHGYTLHSGVQWHRFTEIVLCEPGSPTHLCPVTVYLFL